MKISKIIFAIAIASTFLVSSCRETKTESIDDHGHEHNPDGSHMDDEAIDQEEFKVGTDSMETKTDDHGHDHDLEGNHSDDNSGTHKHDNGAEHDDH
tara:strand:- start:4829 stop:5119 length:291 start_codon:yes stop_codon:yes gene_type:complete